jgi:hypothetical protein
MKLQKPRDLTRTKIRGFMATTVTLPATYSGRVLVHIYYIEIAYLNYTQTPDHLRYS